MNLLCPNCQKMLTVPEQYAGQLMKCPLCAGTFTVPGLPPAPTAAMPPPTPPPPTTYPLQAEPPVPSAPPLTSQASTAPASSITGTPPPPPSPPGGPMTFSLWFKPEIVQWIAPAAVILILIFTLFFPWVGVYPGGQAAAWQYPYQIVYGGYSADSDMGEVFHFPTRDEIDKDKNLSVKEPGWSFLMFLYFPLMLLTVAITIGCAVLPVLKLKLPPTLNPVVQWRWAAAAALNLLAFLFLIVLILWGFPVESSVYKWKTTVDDPVTAELLKKETRNSPQALLLKVKQGEASALTSTTIYVKLVVLLHILAIAAAGLMLALDHRRSRPPVHLDLVV